MTRERRSVLLDAALAGVLLALARMDWAMQSLYHRDFGGSEVAGAMAVLAGGFAGVLAATGLASGHIGAWFVRCVLVSVGCYILQGPLRAAGLFGEAPLTAGQKGVILLGVATVAGVLTAWLRPPTWLRLRGALVAAASIYALSPFVLAWWMAPTLRVDLRAFAPQTLDGLVPRATMVVLLDEWAAATISAVLQPLQEAGVEVRSAALVSSGQNTIDVVPRMFGSAQLVGVRECTPSALCGETTIFDFSRLAFAPEQRVHVVGMFHPYCTASGIRSCYHQIDSGDIALRQLACTFLRLVPAESLACGPRPLEDWRRFRAHVLDAVRYSSFWTDGGTLFAHVPLPHPPGDTPGGSLQTDYDKNLRSAGTFVLELWTHARQQFGDDVQLIVTSDHSLRRDLWCKSIAYAREGCTVPSAWTDGRVPMVVAAGRPFSWQPPATNAGLFAARAP